MSWRAPWVAGSVLAFGLGAARSPSAWLTVEEATRMSDRIVIGTVLGASGGSALLPNGRTIDLGVKDPATGLVFTPYRIRVTDCLLDTNDSCRLGESEVFVPGGTVDETIDGRRRLRTFEIVGVAGTPLPPAGGDVVLFMRRRHDRFYPLNDPGARLRVDRSSGDASVAVRLGSPRFPGTSGSESSGAPPGVLETVGLVRLKELIVLTRHVPMPPSGMGHAISDLVDAREPRVLGGDGHRLCTGEVP